MDADLPALPSLPAEEAGFDPDDLARAAAALESRVEARALLVARGGALVLERYYHGTEPGIARNVKSITKSVQSTLVGIALGDGLLGGLDDRVADILPASFPALTGQADLGWSALVRTSDELRRTITVRHLLTMSTSLVGSDFDDTYNRVMAHAPDQVRFAAALPVDAPPGSVFRYNTANAMLLNGVLEAVTGGSPLAFARARLFEPIGARVERWLTDQGGLETGGSELHMTARDMMRFGWLHLGRGAFGGHRVVGADFVNEALAEHVRFAAPPGDPAAALLPGASGYGWLWWHRRSAGTAMACAWGFGGQFICLVPSLELAVVTLSSLRLNEPFHRYLFEVVDRVIVSPLLSSSDALPRIQTPTSG